MKTLVLGMAVGYVLGARAGHTRYEQIVRTYRTMVDHPAVQGAAGIARAKVGELLGNGTPIADTQPPGHSYNGHERPPAAPPRN